MWDYYRNPGNALEIFLNQGGILYSGGSGYYSGSGYTSSGGGSSSNLNNDPFLKNSNGKIIATPTGTYLHQNIGNGLTAYMKQVTLSTTNGQIIAFEVVNVYDLQGNYLTLVAKYKSNCFGFALADGDYWFLDNKATQLDEFAGFQNMIYSNYIECSEQEATLVIMYANFDGSAYHAGIRNPDGTYTAANGIGGGAQTYSNYNAFSQVNGYNTAGSPKFYKRK